MHGSLAEIMAARPVIFDGAMGTELYKKNQFINVCFEELCLRNPDLVLGIHEANRQAGADVLTTNSFGANRFKLADHLLADKAAEIAAASARLARQVAGESVFVAGSVGPLGRAAATVPEAEALEAFIEVIEALMAAGADFVIFETFGRRKELEIAVKAARLVKAPFVPCMSFGDIDTSLAGETIEEFFSSCLAPGQAEKPLMLGFNCSVGPKQMLEFLEGFVPRSPLPVLAMPNAGFPQRVNDRMFYMTSPDYFRSYAARFVELGSRGVGGCCGTGPEHIAEAAKAIKALHRTEAPQPLILQTKPRQPLPLPQRSSFGRKLAAGQWVTSVEITPPLGWDLARTVERSRRCAEAGVDAINIPDGPRASARVSPLVTAYRIQQEAGIEAVLHVTCRDRNIIGVQSDLLGCAAAGINNLLLITGDPPKLGDYPNATAVFDIDAVGLTGTAARLNAGIDVSGKEVKPQTRFVIGVGADPTNLDQGREVSRFFRKVEAGAEYAVTQPVYDAEALLRFLDRVRPAGIPVIAGIWPLASYNNALFLNNEVPGMSIPRAVLDRMQKVKDKEEARNTGVEIAREILEAVRGAVAGVQVSAPFGKVETALAVLDG